MKIVNGFEIKEIADNFIAIPTQDNIVDFSSIIMLNETSAFLWLKLENDLTEEELVAALLAEYDVEEKTAREDVSKFYGTTCTTYAAYPRSGQIGKIYSGWQQYVSGFQKRSGYRYFKKD